MSTRGQELTLGVVVLAFIGLAVGTVIFIYPSLGVETRMLKVAFHHDRGVAPVRVDSPVLLSGAMQVGKVTEIRKQVADYEPGEGTSLWIVLTVEVETSLILYNDCEIATDQPPVGGAGVVVIRTVGTPGRDVIPDGDLIVGLPAQSLAATIGDLSRRLTGKDGVLDKIEGLVDPDRQGSLVWTTLDLLGDVKAMTTALKTELDGQQRASLLAKVHGIMGDLQSTARAIAGQVRSDEEASMVAKLNLALDELGAALTDARGVLRDSRPQLDSVLTNIDQATRQINEDMLPKLTAELDREDPRALLGKVHASMDTLRRSLEDVEGMTDASRKLILSSTPGMERVVGNLVSTSQTVKLAVEELRAAPWRLIRFTAPSAAEEQDLDVLEAARTFAEAATYLDDTAARLEVILRVAEDQPTAQQQAEIEKMRASLQAAFQRFERAESFFWEKLK